MWYHTASHSTNRPLFNKRKQVMLRYITPNVFLDAHLVCANLIKKDLFNWPHWKNYKYFRIPVSILPHSVIVPIVIGCFQAA